jgi:hypothetical protein
LRASLPLLARTRRWAVRGHARRVASFQSVVRPGGSLRLLRSIRPGGAGEEHPKNTAPPAFLHFAPLSILPSSTRTQRTLNTPAPFAERVAMPRGRSPWSCSLNPPAFGGKSSGLRLGGFPTRHGARQEQPPAPRCPLRPPSRLFRPHRQEQPTHHAKSTARARRPDNTPVVAAAFLESANSRARSFLVIFLVSARSRSPRRKAERS